MMSTNVRIVIASLLVTMLAAADSTAQPAAPNIEIVHVAGGLYRVRTGSKHTVFKVTPAGIVLVDALGLETTQWLKAEFEKRFPPGIVRYVVYTIHDEARSEGAGTFNDTAEIVGHREFNHELSKARRASDGAYRRVRDAESHFDGRRSITLGGSTLEAIHAPLRTAPENTIVVFPEERRAFATSAPLLETSPFSFGPFKPREVNRWLATVSALDFDVLLLGDGRSMQKAELLKLSRYVDALIAQVASEYEAGRSAAEFLEAGVPAAFRSDALFRNWRANVSDVHRDVALFRIDATIGALGNYTVRDELYCINYIECATGGAVPAGLTSLNVTAARVSFIAEVTAVEDAFSSRASRSHDEEFALRETRVSVLAGYNMPAGSATFRVLGGISHTIADRRGIERIKGGFAPFAGRHPIASRDSRFAMSGGVDLVFGRRVAIVLPLRVNYAFEDAKETWPSKLDAQAGLAITVRLLRSIR